MTPKGYILFISTISDPDGLNAYRAAATPTLIDAGGTGLIAGPPHRVVEGSWSGDATVLIEFDSLATANAWYDSPEYQAVIGRRLEAATSHVAIFEGFEPPSS